jgi:alkaline phosphatase D
MGLFQSFFDVPYLFSVDQWDGFPDKRAELLDAMREVENVVLIAGDIHSTYVTDHGQGGGSHPVYELVGAGISSEPFKGFVRGRADQVVPNASKIESVAALIDHLEEFLIAAAPQIAHASNDSHGFVVVECSATALRATIHAVEDGHVNAPAPDAAAATAPYVATSYTIDNGALSMS